MSSESNLNKSHLTWSYPGGPGDGDGMVWYGLERATLDDIQEIKDFRESDDTGIDKMSLCGRYDRNWNSASYASMDMRNPNGGLGSVTYEHQHINHDQVQFAKEPRWHYNADGEFVKEVPADCGAYHRVDLGEGYYDYYSGPEPESPAAEELGNGHYIFHWLHKWYEVE